MSWQQPNPFGGPQPPNPFGGTPSGQGAFGGQPGGAPGHANPFGGGVPGMQGAGGPGFPGPGLPGPGLPGPPPPRKKNRLLPVMVIALVLLVLGGGVSAAVLLGRNSSSASNSEVVPSEPVRMPTVDPSAASSPTSSATPTASATPSRRTSPGATSRPSGESPTGPYLSMPELADNPLYRQPMGTWSCGVNPTPPTGSEAERKAWVEKSIDCMMQRYGPVLEKTGKHLERPRVTYYKDQFTSPCGTMRGHVAYYCSGDTMIYIDYAKMLTYDDYVRLGSIHMIFHEFGHHVQHTAGILNAGLFAEQEDREQRQRRVEQQVECWTYVQVQSWDIWKASDEPQYRRWAQMDQDSVHGRGTSYTYWFEQSNGAKDLSACNTWVAPKQRVQ